MVRRMLLILGGVGLLALVSGCCADPCDPLCPGNPCDSAVGPCDPCVCQSSHRTKLVPKKCRVWPCIPDPCDDQDLDPGPCYRDPAEGIGDTPMTTPDLGTSTGKPWTPPAP